MSSNVSIVASASVAHTDISQAAQPSTPLFLDSTTQNRRGATRPVFLHYTSFYQLSVHRTCARREDAEKGKAREADWKNVTEGGRRYALLVHMEDKRRRQRQRPRQPDDQPTESMHRRFSTALLDAAYHSVVNASSKRHSTNEAQFFRLRACAIQKHESLDRAETCEARMDQARREGDQKEATMVSLTNREDDDTTKEAEVGGTVASPVDQQPVDQQPVDQQQTDLSTFLRMLGACAAVPSIQEKPHTEVLQYQQRHMLRHIHMYKAVISRLQAGIRENDVSEADTQEIASVGGCMESEPRQQLGNSKSKVIKSTLAQLRERLYCEICEGDPRRKKEVAIRWCGHAMCRACVRELKKVRNLHCPFCRVSFSVPNDLQLLIECKMSDLTNI